MSTDERLLTPAEVARLFRVDPKTVTRWARRGLLKSVTTPGGHRRFYETQVYNILSGGIDAGSDNHTADEG